MRSLNRRRLSSRFGNREEFSIPLPSDAGGYTGRECPNCERYFKIVTGTGLKEIETCYCPYCGCHDDHSCFHTAAQIEYAKSVVVDNVSRRIGAELKKMARDINRRSWQSSGFLNISMEVRDSPSSIRRYPKESELETYIECTGCTLKYAVYGVYGFCPDCGQRNALQILGKNLDIAAKILDLRDTVDNPLREALTGNALTSVVSAFDGFGREVCRASASKSASPSKAERIRFQNLVRAQEQVRRLFRFDIASTTHSSEWEIAIRCFQKRHLLEHKSGVVDKEYLERTNDPTARLGRMISLTAQEVVELIDILRKLGMHIFSEMEKLP